MKKNDIMNTAKQYLATLAELMQEDIAQARQEWTDADCPSDAEWSIDLTVDSIIDDYRRDMERYIANAVEAYNLTAEQADELEKAVC